MVRRGLTAVGVALTLATSGCGADSSDTPTAQPSPTCTPTQPGVDVGSGTFDRAPSTRVRTPAGWYFVSATGFEHGGPFDPPVGRTLVAWGPADRTPTYDPGPATVGGASGTFEVVEDKGTWVQLPEGEHWFLNSNGAELSIAGCAPGIPILVPGG